MVYLRVVFCYCIAIVLSTGCSIDTHSGESSTLIIQLPEASQQQKVGRSATFSNDGCFAVNIIGEKIDTVSPGSCDPSYGVFAGLVANGGKIELLAPYGKNRTIEIYYVEASGGCTKFQAAAGLGNFYGSNKVHLISKTKNVSLDKPQVVVEVNIDYPKASNTLATLLHTPAACNKGNTPGIIMASSPVGVVLGAAHGTTANGSKMHVRIINQNKDLNNTSSNTSRIRPIRLGEEQ